MFQLALLKMLQRANYNKMEPLPYISNPASAGLQQAAGSFKGSLV
jgi:hypothetical protein